MQNPDQSPDTVKERVWTISYEKAYFIAEQRGWVHIDKHWWELEEEDEPTILERLVAQALSTLTEQEQDVIRFCIMANPAAMLPAPKGPRDTRYFLRETAAQLGYDHRHLKNIMLKALTKLEAYFRQPWVQPLLVGRVKWDATDYTERPLLAAAEPPFVSLLKSLRED